MFHFYLLFQFVIMIICFPQYLKEDNPHVISSKSELYLQNQSIQEYCKKGKHFLEESSKNYGVVLINGNRQSKINQNSPTGLYRITPDKVLYEYHLDKLESLFKNFNTSLYLYIMVDSNSFSNVVDFFANKNYPFLKSIEIVPFTSDSSFEAEIKNHSKRKYLDENDLGISDLNLESSADNDIKYNCQGSGQMFSFLKKSINFEKIEAFNIISIDNIKANILDEYLMGVYASEGADIITKAVSSISNEQLGSFVIEDNEIKVGIFNADKFNTPILWDIKNYLISKKFISTLDISDDDYRIVKRKTVETNEDKTLWFYPSKYNSYAKEFLITDLFRFTKKIKVLVVTEKELRLHKRSIAYCMWAPYEAQKMYGGQLMALSIQHAYRYIRSDIPRENSLEIKTFVQSRRQETFNDQESTDNSFKNIIDMKNSLIKDNLVNQGSNLLKENGKSVDLKSKKDDLEILSYNSIFMSATSNSKDITYKIKPLKKGASFYFLGVDIIQESLTVSTSCVFSKKEQTSFTQKNDELMLPNEPSKSFKNHVIEFIKNMDNCSNEDLSFMKEMESKYKNALNLISSLNSFIDYEFCGDKDNYIIRFIFREHICSDADLKSSLAFISDVLLISCAAESFKFPWYRVDQVMISTLSYNMSFKNTENINKQGNFYLSIQCGMFDEGKAHIDGKIYDENRHIIAYVSQVALFRTRIKK